MLASQGQEICIMHWIRKQPKELRGYGDTCTDSAHTSLGVAGGMKEGGGERAKRERRQVQASDPIFRRRSHFRVRDHQVHQLSGISVN